MQENNIIRVIDFAVIPGARYRTDGDNSAEEFFEDKVQAIADKTLIETNGDLTIDLDGTAGYASSFVSELAKLMAIRYKQEKKVKKVKQRISIKSDEDPGQIDRFWNGFNKKY